MSDEKLLVAAIAASAVICAVIAVIYSITSSKEEQRRKVEDALRYSRLIFKANEFIAAVNERKALEVVGTSLILKPDEYAFYSAPSALHETRAVRHYQSGSTGFRVMKGVWVGGSSGRSVSSQEWSAIDTGTLTITNKRLIFDGSAANRTVPIGKIVSSSSMMDAIEVSVEGKQKSMVFSTDRPLIASSIITICAKVPNPLDLSESPVKFTFE